MLNSHWMFTLTVGISHFLFLCVHFSEVIFCFWIDSRLDQGLTEMYTCPTCRKPLFTGQPENETNTSAGVISSDEQLARQMSAVFDRQNSARQTMPAGLFPNQTMNNAEGVSWRCNLQTPCYMSSILFSCFF